MRIVLIVILGVAIGLLGGWLACASRARRVIRKSRSGAHVKQRETAKTVIWICLANGFAWVWCSYALAYLDHPQIAESLSQVAVTEIIGVVLAYCIKSVVENLSKNNNWPDKTPPEEKDDGGKG